MQILDYERTASLQARQKKAKPLYDKHVYAEMLAMSSVRERHGWTAIKLHEIEFGKITKSVYN